MKSKKPTVTLKCPANAYSSANERIIEFSDSRGNGGLISFREGKAGISIDIYRCNGLADLRAPKIPLVSL